MQEELYCKVIAKIRASHYGSTMVRFDCSICSLSLCSNITGSVFMAKAARSRYSKAELSSAGGGSLAAGSRAAAERFKL